MDGIFPTHSVALGLILGIPNMVLMLLRFIDEAAQYSRQRLYYANKTYLVPAGGKLALKTKTSFPDDPGDHKQTGYQQFVSAHPQKWFGMSHKETTHLDF